MTAKFPAFFGAAVAILGAVLWFAYASSGDSRLRLTGEILKVRTLELAPDSTLVMLDFRMRNESDVNFVLKEASIVWTRADGRESEATTVARPDLDRIFQYSQQAGPKYNEIFVTREKLTAKAMLDRMAAGSVPVSEAAFNSRKAVKLRLVDLDGQTFDFDERANRQQVH